MRAAGCVIYDLYFYYTMANDMDIDIHMVMRLLKSALTVKEYKCF